MRLAQAILVAASAAAAVLVGAGVERSPAGLSYTEAFNGLTDRSWSAHRDEAKLVAKRESPPS